MQTLKQDLIKESDDDLSKKRRHKKILEELEREGKVIAGTNDCMFKSLFQDKGMTGILAYIISYIVGLSKDFIYKNLNFKPTELAKERFFEHGKITDLLVEIDGTIINLEMNQDNREGYLVKNLGYHHTLSGRNLLVSDNFDKAKKIIQINFDCVNRFDDRIIIPFRIVDDENKYVLDKNFINYHINMEKIREKSYNISELNKFEKIMLILQEESKEKLKELAKGDEELIYMVKKIEEMSYDPEMIGLYDKERMDKLVESINIAEAKDEGKAEGKTEGIIQIAKNMLKNNLPIDMIVKCTNLTKKEIKDLA